MPFFQGKEMISDFSKYPTLLSVRRGTGLSPREVLLKALVDFDTKAYGFSPEAVVVILASDDGKIRYLDSNAPDGLVEKTIKTVNNRITSNAGKDQ